MTDHPVCFFAAYGPCDGRLIRGHLIPKQRVKREAKAADVWDARCWVPCCGGPTGIGGHHGMLDGGKIRLTRAELPPAVEEFAAEYGLVWSLQRDYPGPLGEAWRRTTNEREAA